MAVLRAELRDDFGHVELGAAEADLEPLGYLLVGEALRQEVDYLPFSGRENVIVSGATACGCHLVPSSRGILLKRPRNYTIRKYVLSCQPRPGSNELLGEVRTTLGYLVFV